MDKYAMHAAKIRVFMPKQHRNGKRAKQPKRDAELLRNYGSGLTYNYATLGFYIS